MKNYLIFTFILIALFLVTYPDNSYSKDPLVDSSNLMLSVTVVPNPSPSVSPSTSPSPSPSGNNGGGGPGPGGGGGEPAGNSEVIFRGTSYPKSQVVIVKDGQTIAKVSASPDGSFEVKKSGLSMGAYTFTVWSEDSNGVRSLPQSFTEWLSSNVTTIISGIFLPPTISADKAQVKKGDSITFLGQAPPYSSIDLQVHSEVALQKKATADKSGNWVYTLATDQLELGDHTSKARTIKNTETSPYSEQIGFKVGTENILNQKPNRKRLIADLNDDGKVNLIDFSILAFWYKKSSPPVDYDLNSDGSISIADFSIMAYYWTG